MQTIELECLTCRKLFHRNINEYNRNKKINRKIFCSRNCAGIYHTRYLPTYEKGVQPLILKDYKRKKDKFSPFRKYLRRIITRKHLCNINVADLLNQWDKQEGICPYTGKQMLLVSKHLPEQASLDRIDPDKGYTIDNIQFVCLFIQYGKNSFKDEQVKDFISTIRT
jgi:hypothetical protein